MSDLELLYVVMVAFYLWECTHWLGSANVPFVSWFGAAFRITRPFFVANSREGGLVFASAVPMAGTLFVSAEWPVAMSPSGVANRDGGVLRFDDQPRLESRRRWLMAKGRRFARAASGSHAQWLAKAFNDACAAAAPDRPGRMKQLLRDTLDVKQAADRRLEFNRTAFRSSAMAAGLFLYMFLIAPVLVWRMSLIQIWPYLLCGLALLCLVNAVAFHCAHKRLHPGLDDERFSDLLMVLLFPPAGMRARDFLSRPALERFHPLALAKALCADDAFAALAGRTLRELRYPLPTEATTSGDAQPIWEWHRQTLLEEAEGLVTQGGLSVNQLTAVPARSEPESRAFCPRCNIQFTRTEGTCSDCGVALQRFD